LSSFQTINLSFMKKELWASDPSRIGCKRSCFCESVLWIWLF